MKRAVTARIRRLSFGSNTSRNRSNNQRPEKTAPLGTCLAGANFLPAARAFGVLQNLFAQADGFRGEFHVLMVGNKFDRLLETQLAERDKAARLVRNGRAHDRLLRFLCGV